MGMTEVNELLPAAAATYSSFVVPDAFVAGQWRSSATGESFPVSDPATGAVIGHAARFSADEVKPVIDAAEAAFFGWAATLPQVRSDFLLRWAEFMLRDREALGALITAEQGKPLSEAIGEIEYGASFVRWFGEQARRSRGETIESHLPSRALSVVRVPVGVVAAITPWNFPSAMMARKASAALAAGCTVIGVPSSATPFSALALARLATEAGCPDGVFSVITGNARVLVPELCRDERVRAVTFTGSTEVGRKIAALCAPTVKRLCLELGGLAPFIVFDDADLDAAVAGAMQAKFQTSGQDCLAANRIYVQANLYEAFLERMAKATNALTVGNGFAPAVDIGPLIDEDAVAKVESHVRDALEKGGRLLAGGQRHPAGRLFFSPTVIADAHEDMLVMREETFGPLAAIARFEDEAEVMRLANDTEMGLAGYIYTRSHDRARRTSRSLQCGMIGVNASKITGAPVPFGGLKQSGYGREGSHHGLEQFTDLKYICEAFDAT